MKKNISLSTLLFLLVSQSWADSIICTPDVGSTMRRSPLHKDHSTNHELMMVESVRADCDDGYSFEISGIGGGLRIGAGGMTITCPFVENLSGTYAGVKVAGGAVVAFQGGIYVGAGVCFIGGIEFGIGAGVSLGTLKIVNINDQTKPPAEKQAEPITEKKFELDKN